jgi:Kef-type K+ transport system membrane component KefB
MVRTCMDHHLPLQDPVLQFSVLVLVALVVQLTVEKARLPGLIGLLLAGIALGPDGAGVMTREPVPEMLGHVGLVYIMFLAGVEVNLKVLREHRREVAGFGMSSFALTFALVGALGWWLALPWQGALLLATALSSHTLVGYPIVKQLGLLDRQPVVTAVGGTLLTDTSALVTLAVVAGMAGRQETGTWGWLLPLALLALVAVLAWWLVPRVARRLFAMEGASTAEKALFVLAVLLGLASLVELMGAEPILGAFLAGLCLNEPLRQRPELNEHLTFVGRMVFIPFFFIDTGMRIDAGTLVGDAGVWAMAAGLVAALAIGKAAAAWLVGQHYGYSRNARGLMFSLTLPQAAATLAVTITAARMDLLNERMVDAVILVILLTCLAGPLLTRHTGTIMQRHQPQERRSPVQEPHKNL